MSDDSGHHPAAAALAAGRVLAVAAVLCYAAALLLPFVHGTIRLLVVPVSRSLTLAGFMRHVAHEQPALVLGLVSLVVFVAPGLLLIAALVCAWRGHHALPGPLASRPAGLRWGGWIVAALGVAFTSGLRAAASASGGPSLRMLPGVWFFCAALLVAATAMSLLTAPVNAGRAARHRAGQRFRRPPRSTS